MKREYNIIDYRRPHVRIVFNFVTVVLNGLFASCSDFRCTLLLVAVCFLGHLYNIGYIIFMRIVKNHVRHIMY